MSFPIHREGDNRACGAKTIAQGAAGSRVYVNGKIPAVEGDPNTHSVLGQLINVIQHNVNIGGISAIPSLVSTSAPDVIGLIVHPQGLPMPMMGSENVFIGQGNAGAGLGFMQQLGLGSFGSLNIGEFVQIAGQIVGQVQNFIQIGGGSAAVQLNNLQGPALTPGTTVTGVNSNYSFTFTNFVDSRLLSNRVSVPSVSSITNALVTDAGDYITIQDYEELFPTLNLTASVITS